MEGGGSDRKWLKPSADGGRTCHNITSDQVTLGEVSKFLQVAAESMLYSSSTSFSLQDSSFVKLVFSVQHGAVQKWHALLFTQRTDVRVKNIIIVMSSRRTDRQEIPWRVECCSSSSQLHDSVGGHCHTWLRKLWLFGCRLCSISSKLRSVNVS